jgi:uncharacterized RDD family membrane protein YckC
MMPVHDTLRIQTAENVGIGFRIAGLGSRFLAQLVDLCIIIPVMIVLAVGGFALVGAMASSDVGATIGGVGVLTSIALFYYGYFGVLESVMGGQTPGKRALHVRVIRADGGAIAATESMLRNLVRLVDTSVFGIGALVIFASSRSQRLGDMAARTIVVRDAPQVALHMASGHPPVLLRTADGGLPLAGIERVGQHEFTVLRSFLARPDLHVLQRQRIATGMAATLHERMGIAPGAEERTWAPELFLERLYIQLAQRFGGP